MCNVNVLNIIVLQVSPKFKQLLERQKESNIEHDFDISAIRTVERLSDIKDKVIQYSF